MDDFINWKDWWSEKYRFHIGEGIRYFPIKIALNLFLQREGKIIVETGTTRAIEDFGGAGMATILFGDFAKKYDKQVYTVDILPEAISLCKGLTEEYKDKIEYVVSDSINFLRTFKEPIDLLYLDSMDCPIDDDPNNPELKKSQEHQLAELQAAWDKLTKDSIILLDDNGWKSGGKCKLSKQFLREMGWTCVLDDYQSLWIR